MEGNNPRVAVARAIVSSRYGAEVAEAQLPPVEPSNGES
jgi:hypothetical protein